MIGQPVAPARSLDDQDVVAAFIAARQALDPGRWRQLDPARQGQDGTEVAQANVQLILAPVTDALRACRIAVPALVLQAGTHGMGALFHPADWSIRVSRGRYTEGPVTAPEIQRRAADLYHEARHAEQYWLMARAIVAKDGERSAAEKHFLGLVPRDLLGRAIAANAPVVAAATIARWVAETGTIDDVALEREAARTAVIELGQRIDADNQNIPAHFTSEMIVGLQNDLLAARTRSAGQVQDRYLRAFRAYVGLSLEQDAYTVGAQVGGTALPNADQAVQELYDAQVGARLEGLRTRTAARITGFFGPPPAEPDEEDQEPDEPLPLIPGGEADDDSDDEESP